MTEREAPRRRRRRSRGGQPSRESTPTTANKFTTLYFGKAAAENDYLTDPKRFRQTYVDRWDLARQVASHQRFLILGPKGSGKSAASRFIEESWREDIGTHAVQAQNVDFDELNRTQTPLTSLDRRLVSDLVHLTDAAWKLFLGVRLLERLVRDGASSLSSDPHALRILGDLQRAGLASDDYPRVLRTVKERRHSFNFRVLEGGSTRQEGDTLSTGQVGDAVLHLVLNARTSTRHLLAIDGLDKAIADNDSYWQTLAALIRVSYHFNREALSRGANHVFVLVMCRSDVFRRVNLADAPKMVADGGVHLEWHAEAAEPRQVLLWRYLAAKAQISETELLAYLPSSVPVGRQGGVETLKYLLSFTRYMPRDATLLFTEIQQSVRDAGVLNGATVRQAADRFATNHLLPEVTAEAVGLMPNAASRRLQAIVGALPRRVVTLQHLQEALVDTEVSDVSPRQVGEYLFLQGALGNYDPASGYVQFYHRRDVFEFKTRGPWVLHTGLVYALNKPW